MHALAYLISLERKFIIVTHYYQCIFIFNDKTYYLLYYLMIRDPDVSSILSKKLAHIVATVDRPVWLLMALYNGEVVV